MARTPEEIAELLAARRFASVREDFDSRMMERLTEARLRRAWRLMRLAKGRYLGVAGEPIETTRDGLRVVDLPLRYQRSEAKLRVSYDDQDRIAGLFILNPEVQ